MEKISTSLKMWFTPAKPIIDSLPLNLHQLSPDNLEGHSRMAFTSLFGFGATAWGPAQAPWGVRPASAFKKGAAGDPAILLLQPAGVALKVSMKAEGLAWLFPFSS